ncbi:MAG: hypothetical protein PHQ85_10470 [Eubacteriales bacterium]|nr:hypothetical protein [Eubacteriales bacterium]
MKNATRTNETLPHETKLSEQVPLVDQAWQLFKSLDPSSQHDILAFMRATIADRDAGTSDQ